MPDREDNTVVPLTSPGLGLGERLRSARKARALSVQQVADSLRLEEASVVALEDGRFNAMGAPVFVRGHLRRYAQLVGLSPEAVLEAYRAAAPESDALPSIARPRAQADVVRVPQWVYWVGAALILAGLAFALRDGGSEEAVPAVVPATVTKDLAVSLPAPATSAPVGEVVVPPAAMPGEGASGPPPSVQPGAGSPPATAPVAAPPGTQPEAVE